MKTEKPAWLVQKELDDAEIEEYGDRGWTRAKSHGAVYGTSESLVDQVGDGMIDVNHLMARFEKTGKLEELIAAGVAMPGGGMYGDFTNLPSYEDALKIKLAADHQFGLLSAPVRARFGNDPGAFLDFVNDPKNGDELIQMGLRKQPDPQKEPEVTLKDVRDAITSARKATNERAKKESSED